MVVGIIASGCGERERCHAYHYDASFPAAYHDAAVLALERFSAFSGETVIVWEGESGDDSCAFRAISKDSAEYAEQQALMGTPFLAYHDDANGNITIAEDAWDVDVDCTVDRVVCATSILMHESAHEYGLMHVKDPDAVMGTTNPMPRIKYNDSDKKELLRVRGER